VESPGTQTHAVAQLPEGKIGAIEQRALGSPRIARIVNWVLILGGENSLFGEK